MTPGMTAGSVTCRKVCTRPAPQLAAACSRSGSRSVALDETDQTRKGRLMTAQATPTGQRLPSTRHSPKTSMRADARANERHGEGQKQIDLQRIGEAQAVAREGDPRQRAYGQRHQRADRGHHERAAEGLPQVAGHRDLLIPFERESLGRKGDHVARSDRGAEDDDRRGGEDQDRDPDEAPDCEALAGRGHLRAPMASVPAPKRPSTSATMADPAATSISASAEPRP